MNITEAKKLTPGTPVYTIHPYDEEIEEAFVIVPKGERPRPEYVTVTVNPDKHSGYWKRCSEVWPITPARRELFDRWNAAIKETRRMYDLISSGAETDA